jgi:hypothetical protein
LAQPNNKSFRIPTFKLSPKAAANENFEKEKDDTLRVNN